VSAAPAGLSHAVGEALGDEVVELAPVAGGDLNDAFRARTARGADVFVKTAGDAPTGGYAAEARGLAWLEEAGALPVPRVLAVGEDDPGFLALEWVAPGRPSPATAEELGRGLARLHLAGADGHGGPDDVLRLGPLELPNAPAPDAATFLLERRLRPLVERAVGRRAIDPAARTVVERLGPRLPELLGTPEPPARLHGDLWAGNVHVGPGGRPWLVDPAAHGGHREVDLALLRLFGSGGLDGPRIHDAYADVAPLADGAEDRLALWQLTPLLVHAVLFGGGYGARALAVLRRYA
jgi:fructosamine-3-kinase